MKIDAYVVEEINATLVRETLTIDDPGPGEVLVKVVATGVCHTDLNTQSGDMPLPLPGVLGHEGSGVVEAVGAGVTEVKPGDHVIMGWPYCGTCRNCVRGEHRYCLNIGAELLAGVRLHGPDAGSSAYTRTDGTALSGHFFGQSSFATYSLTRANAVVKVDKDIDLVLLGPLACGITTGAGAVFNTAQPGPNESVVIIGAGAVGLAAVMAACNTPAATIIAMDLQDSRLELARELGATHTVNTREKNIVEAVAEICGGPADYVLDCTGSIKVIEQAADTVGLMGTLILVGGAPAEARFSLDHMRTLFGKTVVGTLGGSSNSRTLIPGLIKLYRQGRFPFDKLITTYSFDELELAIHDVHEGGTIKAVLRIDETNQ
ncbi:alcohol dehydrogenase catalytic domain-containing protein [Corynebacterium poyangense]|uniref:Alcohol dehydrogenase catalytic domain-containing protein n=1 Tax=Corynebacterium poyangense TaxID=2684405 RepID=A0A7H0SRP9_9CORY|nr:NAD(P)-dependent alcohol dehydrogenase [Corynebacterium poyangense]MBZ8176657.1 alcohol dehydrogenase catalytic domain-containing protein [Corynebacterium poyangense]QNQ91224.1 alcohol dehydrogenase catalytic domain-containing protein [Corynebacterium poyangense]